MAKKPDAPPAKKPGGKSLAEFRAAHDKSFIVPKKIREVLAKLGDGWLYEAELMREAQISTTELASYRHQFEVHVVEVGGRNAKRVWFGTEKAAAEARALV
jgi:hypothetical protein